MNRSTRSLLAAAVASAAALAQNPAPPVAPLVAASPAAALAAPGKTQPSRAIDLVICLDVSGSMQGLIDAARQNLWAVVNDLATLEPQPDLRVALLTYGCPDYGADTGFVMVQTPLTSDLDLVSQKLFALTTNGGDEYVARVVRRALDELQWSADAQALKLLFVAGNEAATQDPLLDALAQSKAAIERGILVNTIYCGSPQHGDADAWRQVAQHADGQFAAIEKDAAMVIATPFDAPLQDLSAKLNTTYVPYGKDAGVWVANQAAQDSNAAGLNVVAAAQRCQTKASSLYFNAGWDLVDACRDPNFDLAKIAKEELPEALRALSVDQLRAHVAVKQTERSTLQQQAAELGKQRDAFVAAELAKVGEAGEKRFEQAVLESVRAQAKSRGFERKAEAAPAPAAPQAIDGQLDPAFVPVIEQAAKSYEQFVRVTGEPKVAPTDCRLPGPFARVSRAETAQQHGGKLYLLYARIADAATRDYVKSGEPAAVGQTLVKEAWDCVPGPQTAATEASKRYPLGLTIQGADGACHAGAAHGLFVMHKLANNTPGTDQGWVYGTIDAQGHVTGAGRMASCMRCHQDAPADRRFGLR